MTLSSRFKAWRKQHPALHLLKVDRNLAREDLRLSRLTHEQRLQEWMMQAIAILRHTRLIDGHRIVMLDLPHDYDDSWKDGDQPDRDVLVAQAKQTLSTAWVSGSWRQMMDLVEDGDVSGQTMMSLHITRIGHTPYFEAQMGLLLAADAASTTRQTY